MSDEDNINYVQNDGMIKQLLHIDSNADRLRTKSEKGTNYIRKW